jgi:hypothetical protein
LIVAIVIDTISVSIKPSSIALIRIVGIEQTKNQTTNNAFGILGTRLIYFFSRRSVNTSP